MAEQFFETRKAAALFKHAVLESYVFPFASKTGSTSQGGRVVFVDGYAGEGRYSDGLEGSPALAMRRARELTKLRRQLDCMFVEQDGETYHRLQHVIASEGGGVNVETRRGSITDHLDDVLQWADGVPLLLFLDPFGLAPPLEEVHKVFKRPGGPGSPATEVLVNFTATGLRRIAGLLHSDSANPKTLARLDETCGGDWWRDVWLKHVPDRAASDVQRQAAEEAVISGYAREVAKAARSHWWTFEVRNRPDLKPIYHLVFFTRHSDGLALFGESLSLGLEKWRRAVYDAANSATLFGSDEAFNAEEKRLAAGWTDEIVSNLKRLLGETPRFQVIRKYNEALGTALGHAREKHLRAAWKRLHASGHANECPTGPKLAWKYIERGPSFGTTSNR